MDPEVGTTGVPLLQDSSAPTRPDVYVREPWHQQAARATYNFLTHIGSCILFGILTAMGLKVFGQAIAMALVLLFIAFQVLAYYGYVSMNWAGVRSAVYRRMDLNQDGNVTMADCYTLCERTFKAVMGWGVPSVGGFLLGFWLGWKLLR